MPSTIKSGFLRWMYESSIKLQPKWQVGGPFSQTDSSSAARRRLKLFAIHLHYSLSLLFLSLHVFILKEKCLKSGINDKLAKFKIIAHLICILTRKIGRPFPTCYFYFSARMPERARLTVRELLKLSDLQAIERVAYFLERVASLFVRRSAIQSWYRTKRYQSVSHQTCADYDSNVRCVLRNMAYPIRAWRFTTSRCIS